jgi:hypothetical protein
MECALRVFPVAFLPSSIPTLRYRPVGGIVANSDLNFDIPMPKLLRGTVEKSKVLAAFGAAVEKFQVASSCL